MTAARSPRTHRALRSDCRYCTAATLAELEDLMFHVADLAFSRVFLYRDQTHHGRCVVLFKEHARELFDLTPDERHGFMDEVAAVAAAVAQAVPCDKVNYAAYGDRADHLHFHVAPKTAAGPAWGQPFVLNATPPVLLAPAERQALVGRLRALLSA